MPTKMKNGKEFTAMVFGYKGKDGYERIRCCRCDEVLEPGQDVALHVSEIGVNDEAIFDFAHTNCRH